MRSTLGATVGLTAGLIVAMSWAAPAGAAPGDLDGSFSGDGWVRTLDTGGTPLREVRWHTLLHGTDADGTR